MSKKQAPKPSKPKSKRAGKDPAGEKDAKRAKRERRPGELSRPQKVVIIVFIVIFAFSTLAGAIASVVQSDNQTVEYNVDYVDSQYESTVADLESKVEADPSDTDSLLSLAQNCASWGRMVGMLAQTDDERSHGTELLQRALGYYDQYLELSDTPEARTERALCEYYLGETDQAVADLEAVTQASPDYAPAWADLGMLYESQGSTDQAVAAYEQAVEKDPDDEAGAKSYAEGRLESLRGADADGSADDGSDAAGTDGTDATDTGADGATDDAGASE